MYSWYDTKEKKEAAKGLAYCYGLTLCQKLVEGSEGLKVWGLDFSPEKVQSGGKRIKWKGDTLTIEAPDALKEF